MKHKIQEIQEDKELTDLEKAILIIALYSLIDNNKNLRRILALYKLQLEQIRKEVSYAYSYKDSKELKQTLHSIVKDLSDKEIEIIRKALQDTYKSNHTKLLKALNKTDIGDLEDSYIDSELDKEFYGDTYSNRIIKSNKLLALELSQILEQDKDIDEIDKEIKELLESKANRSKLLFENELFRVHNLVLLSMAKEIYFSGKVRYSAYMDSRVCPECADFDGIIFDIDSAPELPRHPRCRCTYFPVS